MYNYVRHKQLTSTKGEPKKQHPDGKTLVVVDEKHCEHDIKWYREYGHYVIDVDCKRYCSCDTIQEVREELAEIQKEFSKNCCRICYSEI